MTFQGILEGGMERKIIAPCGVRIWRFIWLTGLLEHAIA